MSRHAEAPARVRAGPAGWPYRDWAGQVYPKPRPRGPAPLRHLARFFDAVEVHSTSRRIPEAQTTRPWAERVREHPPSRCTAKLGQGFPHGGTAGAQDAAACRRATDPPQEGGRLGAVLRQFPYRFHPAPGQRAHRRRLADVFGAYPLVPEVRHRSWGRPEVYGFLREPGVGFCDIDQPQVASAIGLTAHVPSPVGYLRLHGRNVAHRLAEGAGAAARDDDRYPAEELRAIGDVAEVLSRQARETYLITNNGQRPQNAAPMTRGRTAGASYCRLMRRLGERWRACCGTSTGPVLRSFASSWLRLLRRASPGADGLRQPNIGPGRLAPRNRFRNAPRMEEE